MSPLNHSELGKIGLLSLAFVLVLCSPVLSQSDSSDSNSSPLNLQVEISNGAVILTWDAPTVNADSVTGYEILRKRPTKGEKKFKTYVNNTNTTTYTDLNATEAGVKYVYRVKALRNDGTKSKKSNNAKITLSSSFYKPQNLEVNITNGAVTLYWDAPRMDSESVTGYEILRKRPTKGEKKLKTYVNNTNSTNTTYTDLNATEAEVRYAYRVKALRNDGTKSKRSNFAKIDLNETLTPLQGYVLNTTVVIVEEPPTIRKPEPTLHAQAAHVTLGSGPKASVSEGGTDLPDNSTTTGEVEVGGSATGNISFINDQDWFAVELQAGKRYQIDLEGASTNQGTLEDPLINSIYKDEDEISNGNDDGGVGRNSQIIYTPNTGGTYFVWVRASTEGTRLGTYTLSVRDITPPLCDLDDEWDSSIPRPSSVRATPNMNGTVTINWKHPTANGYSDNNYVVTHRRLWTMNGPPMGNEGKYGWQEAGTTDWANFTRVVNDNQITIDINATPGEQHAIRVHSVKETGGASACSRPKTRSFWAAKQNESDPDAVTIIQNPFITEKLVYDENGNAKREDSVRIDFKPVEELKNYEIWRAGPDNTFTQVAGGSRCIELVEQGLEDGEEYVQHCKNRIHETATFSFSPSVQRIYFYGKMNGMKSGKTYSYILFPVKDNITYYGGRWDIRHITIP